MEKDEKNEKRYVNNLLKFIFEKPQESMRYQKLENHIKKCYKIDNLKEKEKEESLYRCLRIIKAEMMEPQFKKYIIHGDMKIFYSLFYTFKSTGINNEHIIFLEIIEPLLEFLVKKDAKIVCCSINIIIKIIKENKYFFLKYFNKIYDKLKIIILRKEIEIRNSGYYLDEMMKNIVGIIFQENSENNEKLKLSTKFIVEYLIKGLEENINYPSVDILISSWLLYFETVPQINLNKYYIQIIPSLFKMLCGNIKEVIHISEFCLRKIINSIDTLYEDLINEDPKLITKIFEIVLENCVSKEGNEQIKKCSFELLEAFLKKFEKIIDEYNRSGDNLSKIEEDLISPVSKNCPSSFNNESIEELKNEKEAKLELNKDFLSFGLNSNQIEKVKEDYEEDKITILMKSIPLHLFPNILQVIIQNNSKNLSFYKVIDKCNKIFINVIKILTIKSFKNKLEEKQTFELVIKDYIQNKSSFNELNINLIFDWISLLYKIELFHDEDYLSQLIMYFPEINELSITRIMSILNEISKKKNNSKFNIGLINIIIHNFNKKPNMINTFGILIIKELEKIINIEILFEHIANILLDKKDVYFIMRMVNLLNKFLISEEKASCIRNKLNKFGNQGKNSDYFEKLFNLFSYNPFCALLLVLLSNCFELGYFLILHISQMDLKSEDYIELSQVVQVFESSIFNNVRIKLLNPNKHKYLIKTLYAILLLLPQGQAFDSLSFRLRCLEIIYCLDDDDEDDIEDKSKEEVEEEEISGIKERSNTDIYLSDDEISNSDYSNFNLSAKSINNNFQLEDNKCYPLKFLNTEIFQCNNKYTDKPEDDMYEKKGLTKYIHIFNKIQNKKKQFEKLINERNDEIRQLCYSPA